jgi:hypothetical protein
MPINSLARRWPLDSGFNVTASLGIGPKTCKIDLLKFHSYIARYFSPIVTNSLFPLQINTKTQISESA